MTDPLGLADFIGEPEVKEDREVLLRRLREGQEPLEQTLAPPRSLLSQETDIDLSNLIEDPANPKPIDLENLFDQPEASTVNNKPAPFPPTELLQRNPAQVNPQIPASTLENAITALWNPFANAVANTWAGFNLTSVGILDQLQTFSESLSYDILQLTQATLKNLGLSELTPEQQQFFLRQDDSITRWLADEIRKDTTPTSNDVAAHIYFYLGAAIPDVALFGGYRSVITAGTKFAEFSTANKYFQNLLAAGSYGYMRGSEAGASDFAMMDMLNAIFGPYGKIVTGAALSTYMGIMTSMQEGMTDEDIIAKAALGWVFAMGIGPAEKSILASTGKGIVRWVQRERVILKQDVSDAVLADIAQKNGMGYLRDFYPEIADRGTIKRNDIIYPSPKISPLEAYSARLLHETGRTLKTKDLTKELLVKETKIFLRKLESKPGQFNPIELNKIAESMVEGTFAAEKAWLDRPKRSRKKIVDPGPLAQPEKIVETRTQKKERIAKEKETILQERPVILADAQGETLVQQREVPVGKVKFRDGREMEVKGGELAQPVIAHQNRSRGIIEELDRKVRKRFIEGFKDTGDIAYQQLVSEMGKLEKFLDQTGQGRKVIQVHKAARAASPEAIARVEEVRRKLVKELNPSEVESFENIIQSIANAELVGRKAKIDLPFTSEQYKAATNVELMRHSLSRRSIIQEKVGDYFESFVHELRRLRTEGLIPIEAFKKMQNLQYSPRDFITLLENFATPEILFEVGGKLSVVEQPVKKLPGGEAAPVENLDAMAKLAHAIMLNTYIIRQNRAATEAGRFAREVANPVFIPGKVTKHGAPIERKGYQAVTYFEGGKKKSVLMTDEAALLWQHNPVASQWLVKSMGLVSGVSLLKPIATAFNPAFALVAFPRDMTYVMLADRTGLGYSELLPKALLEMGADIPKVLGNILVSKATGVPRGALKEFMLEGGGFTFSSLLADRASLGFQGKILRGQKVGPFIKSYTKAVHALSSVSEVGELTMRLAYRSRLMKNGMDSKSATQEAMDILRFSRSGPTGRVLDSLIPFFNANVQVLDGLLKAAKADPGRVSSIVGQLIAVEAAITAYNVLVNPDCYRDIHPSKKVGSFIVCLPPQFSRLDKFGSREYAYIEVLKEKGPLTTPFSALAQALFARSIYGDSMKPYLAAAAKQSLPYTENIFFPPLAEAVLALSNYDVFTGEPIYRGPDVKLSAEFTQRTPAIWQLTGEWLGISPDRTRRARDKFIPQNAFLGLLGMNLEAAPPPSQDEFSLTLYSELPVFRRFFGFTSKLTSLMIEAEDVVEQANTERKEIRDPIIRMLTKIQLKEEGLTHQKVAKAIQERSSETFPSGVPMIQQQAMLNMVMSHKFTWGEWTRIRKKYGDAVADRLWHPLIYAKLANETGIARARLYYEKYRELNQKEKGLFRTVSASWRGFWTPEFFQEFERIRKERGEGLGELLNPENVE